MKEIRYLDFKDFEVRADENGRKTLIGYAARFDSLSERLWGFQEKIAPGAFSRSLGEGKDIGALWNHNSDLPIGSTGSGTLKLEEDDLGLKFELTPIETNAGKDAIIAVETKVVRGVSFGFVTIKDEWDWQDDENAIRTLEEVDLIEISPTMFPAYKATSISARSNEEIFKEAKKHFNEQKESSRAWNPKYLNRKLDHLAKKHKISN
jgi:HK97 family phage prohead protease